MIGIAELAIQMRCRHSRGFRSKVGRSDQDLYEMLLNEAAGGRLTGVHRIRNMHREDVGGLHCRPTEATRSGHPGSDGLGDWVASQIGRAETRPTEHCLG